MIKKASGIASQLKRLHSHKPVKRDLKVGKAPGTVTYLGRRAGEKSHIDSLLYDHTALQKEVVSDIGVLASPPGQAQTQWVNIVGLSDEALMGELGKAIGLNTLVVEDIVNTEQRPKMDEYEDYLFLVLKMLYPDGKGKIVKEHVALLLKQQQVFVYQEVKADVFDGVRSRIEAHSGRIRSRGADYLLFALVDALIDNYFLVLDTIQAHMDALEKEVYTRPKTETALKIQQLRKDVITLRGWMSPARELVSRLIETESPLITKDTRVFLRDALDHATEIQETLHIQRELAFSIMELYMSNVSNKMNEVMKVLTIMASIFIPLTFIAGIYGMNFKNMPELEWEYGYFAVLGIMFLLLLGMLVFFKRKDWL
jgi:magnesium transporter